MLNQVKALARKFALGLLRKLNWGDIRIRHHYTDDVLTLDTFKHRNYWFRGKGRELDSMRLLARLIQPGSTILEAGGHIGYLSIYFAKLCGRSGQVIVFEPDPVNLGYLRRNVAELPQIQVVECAIAASSGTRTLFVESLTGQNNSLYSDYEPFKCNVASSGIDTAGYQTISVEAITIDDYCKRTDMRIDFIKIDIEGAEFEALNGMQRLASSEPPILMVEVTRNADEVFAWLDSHRYQIYSDTLNRIHMANELLYRNVFCLHEVRHSTQLAELSADAISI
jgi:FkbM family methyltransferase